MLTDPYCRTPRPTRITGGLDAQHLLLTYIKCCGISFALRAPGKGIQGRLIRVPGTGDRSSLVIAGEGHNPLSYSGYTSQM